MTDLTIIGDEAWTTEELAEIERKKERGRRYRATHREELTAYHRAYREANRERLVAYNREWMRKSRGKGRVLLASLHSLRCTGPERPACRCRKISMYSAVSG